MIDYQTLKLIHILSATIMIGTGLGSAFFLFISYKTAQFTTIRDVLKIVIIADLIFTTPSVIIQLITGWMLSEQLNITETDWFIMVLSVSFIVLILWLLAVKIQYKLKKLISNTNTLPNRFKQLMQIWMYLGIPSFLLAMYIYYLMIFKPFLS